MKKYFFVFMVMLFAITLYGEIGDITFGNSVSIDNVTMNMHSSTCRLDATHFVVAYNLSNGPDIGRGKAFIATVNGTDISYGSTATFNLSGNTYNSTASISLVALDATHIVIVYADGSNSAYGSAVLGTVNGSVITFSDEYVFTDKDAQFLTVAALDANRFVIAYRYLIGGSVSYGRVIVGTASNGTLSFGTPVQFSPSCPTYAKVVKIDTDKIAIANIDFAANGVVTIGNVTGNDITLGTSVLFSTPSTDSYLQDLRLLKFATNKFAISCNNGSIMWLTAKLLICSVSGTVPTFSPKTTLYSFPRDVTVLAGLDDSHFVISYSDEPNGYGISRTVTVTDNAFTINAGTGFFSSNSYGLSSDNLDATHFYVFFTGTTGTIGLGKIGTVEVPVTSLATPDVTISVASNTLTLTWDKIPNAQSYIVQGLNTPEGTFAPLTNTGTINVGASTVTWTTPVSNAKMFYQVKASSLP